MKELNTPKPLLIGVIGLPGAGKTHFAEAFSSMFGAPLIEADLLKRSIFTGRTASKADEVGLKIAYTALTTEIFKAKRTFVIDGHLHTYMDRTQMKNLAKKAGFDVLWLWVQTSEIVAKDRATKRKRGATNTLYTVDGFTRAVKSFELPHSNEEYVVTSGQRTFSSQVRPILAKIAETHEAHLRPPRPTDRQIKGPDQQPPQRRNIFIR